VGRRYGSNEVALEGSETAARWKRDLTGLALYGHGQSAFDVFQADLAEHARLRAARPEAVAEKKMSVAARDEQFAQGWGWVRRVNSMLGVLARTDQSVATALNTAIPADDVGLEAGIRALAAILTEYQGHVAPDAHADKCLASVDALCTALQTSPGAVHTAKGHTVADTAQIDLYDGKLYLCMPAAPPSATAICTRVCTSTPSTTSSARAPRIRFPLPRLRQHKLADKRSATGRSASSRRAGLCACRQERP
jgi:hypothetical protein